jgi:hypothetical protein
VAAGTEDPVTLLMVARILVTVLPRAELVVGRARTPRVLGRPVEPAEIIAEFLMER